MSVDVTEKLCYSVSEAATALGVGRNVMYTLCSRHDFPAIKIGERRIVVPINGLKQWIASQAQGGQFYGSEDS